MNTSLAKHRTPDLLLASGHVSNKEATGYERQETRIVSSVWFTLTILYSDWALPLHAHYGVDSALLVLLNNSLCVITIW